MSFNPFGLKLKSNNVNIIGFSELIVGFIFFIPILALYLEKELFSVTNVAFVFAVQSVANAVLEIPTGAFADIFGRKISYIFGQILFLIGLVFLYIGGSMTVFVLFALLSGAAGAFMSGTDESIIYDTLKQERKEGHYKKVISILSSLWPFGAIVGSVVGGYLAKFSLSLPILLSFMPLSISLILAFFIEEPKYHKEEHKNIFKQMWNSSKVVVQNKQLIILIIVGLIMMAFGETAHNLKPIFFGFKKIPIEYFGIIFGFIFALSSLGRYFTYSVAHTLGDKQTLILAAFSFPFFLILSTLTNGFLSMFFLAITSIPFGLYNIILSHLMNIEIESGKRTTILSINNLLSRLGMALGGPLLGYFADLWNINIAYQLAAFLMLPISFILFFIRNKD